MHFAEIDPATNTVLRVIVADSKAWCELRLGGTWVRTYYATEGKKYAGKGFIYYPEHDNFSPPQPYPSWTLNTTTFQWEAPVPYPTDDTTTTTEYRWDEPTLSWVAVAVA